MGTRGWRRFEWQTVLDPPVVLWSIGRHSSRFPAFASCERFAVHVLGADQIGTKRVDYPAAIDSLIDHPLHREVLARLEAEARAAFHLVFRAARFKDGKRVAVDGPFAETKELVGGFYLIEVPTFEEALAWAAKAPVGMGFDDERENDESAELNGLTGLQVAGRAQHAFQGLTPGQDLVERGAHGIDIADCINRSNCAKREWIIYDWHEKICRADNTSTIAQIKNCGIVFRFITNE